MGSRASRQTSGFCVSLERLSASICLLWTVVQSIFMCPTPLYPLPRPKQSMAIRCHILRPPHNHLLAPKCRILFTTPLPHHNPRGLSKATQMRHLSHLDLGTEKKRKRKTREREGKRSGRMKTRAGAVMLPPHKFEILTFSYVLMRVYER